MYLAPSIHGAGRPLEAFSSQPVIAHPRLPSLIYSLNSNRSFLGTRLGCAAQGDCRIQPGSLSGWKPQEFAL